MSDYVIVSDSSCDLLPELIEESNLVIIPMEFEIDGKNYYHYPDGSELGSKEFYSMLTSGKPATTVQINPGRYIDILTPILDTGKDVLIITLASVLSGTYNASLVAAKELMERYPGRKVYSIDSLSASSGIGLVAYYAARLRSEGKSIDEARDWLDENKRKICCWFTVNDLNYLHRGGRISAASAVVGTMLGIKPMLHLDDTGWLVPVGKVRGRAAALEYILRRFEEGGSNLEGQALFICHSDAYEDACRLRDMVNEKCGGIIKGIYINNIGPVIASHSGPGTLALFYMGTNR